MQIAILKKHLNILHLLLMLPDKLIDKKQLLVVNQLKKCDLFSFVYRQRKFYFGSNKQKTQDKPLKLLKLKVITKKF